MKVDQFKKSLKDMSKEDLAKELVSKEKEYASMRFDMQLGSAKPSDVKKIKYNIALIKTYMNFIK